MIEHVIGSSTRDDESVGSRSAGGRLASAILVSIGVILLAHPVWIEALLIYPGANWAFVPLIHAAISALGLLALVVGATTLRPGLVGPTARQIAFLSVVVVATVPVYGAVLEATIGTGGPPLGYGVRRLFVASLVVAAFLLGRGLATRDRSTCLLGLAIPLVPLLLVVLEWPSGALLEPVVDLYFLLTAGPLLGVEYLGSMILVAGFGLGVLSGRRSEMNTGSSG